MKEPSDTTTNRMKKTLFLILLCAFPWVLWGQNKINIGVLSDFNSTPETQFVLNDFVQEIQKTIGSKFEIEYRTQDYSSIDYSSSEAASKFNSLTKKVDIILLLGNMVAFEVGQLKTIKKPTFALGIIDPSVQKIPKRGDRSGKHNFTYISESQDFANEIEEFQKLAPFKHLAIAFDQKSTSGIVNENQNEELIRLQDRFNIKISPIGLGENIPESLSQLPETVDALYLAIPYGLSREDFTYTKDWLNENKIPTFVMSRDLVELGFLASISNLNGYDQLKRKLSLMIDDYLMGEPLSEMNVYLNQKRELFINTGTIQKIGLNPSFEILLTSNLVENSDQLEKPLFSIDTILSIALKENLTIKASEQDVSISQVDLKLAKANYLPDANVNASQVKVNEESANPLIGQAENSLQGSGSVSQMVFSEQISANIQIQKALLEAQKHGTQQVVFDIIYDCFSSYFNILYSKVNLEIQKENLSVTKRNLDLAKRRSQIGQSNNGDIYRWESEVASAMQQTIEAASNLNIAKAQLNVVLNSKLPKNFDIKNADFDDAVFKVIANQELAEIVKGPFEFQRLVEFFMAEAKKNYPAKKQLHSNMTALERQNKMYQRMYFLPTVSANAQYNTTIARSGIGSEPLPGTDFPGNNWNLGLTASLPIFNKNNRLLNIRKTKIQQRQLQFQIENLDQNLELGVIAETTNLFTTSTNIEYTRVAAENMEKSFKLMQLNYQQGLVSVTQLVDAQRAKIQTKLSHSVAVFEFLHSFIGLEYQIGFYSSLASQEEVNDFNLKLVNYIIKK